jgi:hypothetical protein
MVSAGCTPEFVMQQKLNIALHTEMPKVLRLLHDDPSILELIPALILLNGPSQEFIHGQKMGYRDVHRGIISVSGAPRKGVGLVPPTRVECIRSARRQLRFSHAIAQKL